MTLRAAYQIHLAAATLHVGYGDPTRISQWLQTVTV